MDASLSNPAASGAPPFAYTINDVVRMGGMSRATIFRELKAGRLKARKLGARTLILASDWQDYLDNLPPRAA